MPNLRINPLTANQNAGRKSNDVEVLIGKRWMLASSVSTTLSGVLHWKSEFFKGNSPEDMWRWAI